MPMMSLNDVLAELDEEPLPNQDSVTSPNEESKAKHGQIIALGGKQAIEMK